MRTWLHNLGVVLVCAQVCIVYFSAAAMKSTGTAWVDGTATYLVAQHPLFGSPQALALLSVPALLTLSTYGVYVLQAWYPLALLSPLRRPWLALVLAFHAWTAVGMGLHSFGLIMVAVNLPMFRDAELAALAAWARRLAARRAAPALPEGADGGPSA